MATPNQEAIDTFISITGSSDAVAVHKLQEHSGDLNQAVNAFFSEGNQTAVPVNVPLDDAMDVDDVIPAAAAPFSPLNSDSGTSIFDSDPLMRNISHPIEVRDSSRPSEGSSDAPIIENVTEKVHVQGQAAEATVTIDEESDDDVPFASIRRSRQVIPAPTNIQDNNDIEEEMIRAAIEASKMEAEEGLSNSLPVGRLWSHMGDDDDMAKAVTQALNRRLAAPSSPFEDHSDDEEDEEEEEPLVRHRPVRVASGSPAQPDGDRSRSGSPEGDNQAENGNRFPSEWGGISSEEHDEAVMLEAAMFGGVPEARYNHLPFLPPQQRAPPRPPSPSLTAQRLIREQQDDEYLASLQADRDKEVQSIRDAEARQIEEETARKAFLEEAQRKLEEEQELERQLAAKEASLPKEPHADEENVITLLVRMADGTRHGRRFLRSDKLQSLFDFIDIARVIKPKTYRLVRPYPRHAFGDGESESTLNDLGFSSKQEALFLELI